MNEQERLAQLVGVKDLEPVDTASILEGLLKEKLGASSLQRISIAKKEIESSGDVVEQSDARIPKSSKTLQSSKKSLPEGYSTEKVMLSLYDLREDLIEAFETSSLNTVVSERITSSIRKSESCIRDIGGEVEEFVPLNHVSGLQAPNFLKNAEKVIETTLQCYTLGKIEAAKIKEEGKAINIVFSGKHNDVIYVANGTIRANEWTGNEAIDYIYTPNEGKMSVKAYENGRWIDRSSSGKYQVYWELEEKSLNDKKEKTPYVSKEDGEIKEGEVINSQNKISEEQKDMEEDIGEPIKQKE